MLFFVYGTLKKNQSNHWLINEVRGKFVSKCKTVYKHPMYQLNQPFPYLDDVQDKGHVIQGELYEIHKKFEDRLDDFEGVPDLYKKGLIKVILNDKVEIANCYFTTNAHPYLTEDMMFPNFDEYNDLLEVFKDEEKYAAKKVIGNL